jgi:catechol 2,3-dioxygenase-like lactoylglutathione lyase family enzyme
MEEQMLTEALKKTVTARVPEERGVPHPSEYAHIVLKTSQPDAMIDWYCKLLGMSVVMRTPLINFLTWDGSQDRLAILAVPEGQSPRGEHSNLHHVAFAYERLADTVAVYRAVGKDGINPHWCVNHGVATSYYYRDPDGNSVELSVENFPTTDALNEWLATGAFNQNPIGVTLDPNALAQRIESGEAETSILQPHPDHASMLQVELDRIAKGS